MHTIHLKGHHRILKQTSLLLFIFKFSPYILRLHSLPHEPGNIPIFCKLEFSCNVAVSTTLLSYCSSLLKGEGLENLDVQNLGAIQICYKDLQGIS